MTSDRRDSSSILASLSDAQYRLLVLAANAVLIGALLTLRFCYDPELPPMPPEPKGPSAAEARAASQRVDKRVEVYKKHLRRDARELGLGAPPSVEDMAELIPYRQSRMRHLLIPGRKDTVEFAGLRLKLRIGEVEGSVRPHMLLDIENTTDTPVAYRVTTRPSKGVAPCSKKRDLGHNAIAVAAGSTETRSECIYRRPWGLEIQRIEVMPVKPLSHRYLSLVPPSTLGIDARVAGGHLPAGGGRLCNAFLSGRNQRALQSGHLTWRDLVDFYARHPCRVYDFPSSYRAFTPQDGDTAILPSAVGR